MWRFPVSQNLVAPGLVVNLVAQLGEDADGILTGDDRESAHTATSTTSSTIGGGIGSPCLARLAR